MDKKIVKKPVSSTNRSTQKKAPTSYFVFEKGNFMWMYISIAVIIVGFMLMAGNQNIYDTRKLIVAPLVVLAGFSLAIYAIMKKPAHKEAGE